MPGLKNYLSWEYKYVSVDFSLLTCDLLSLLPMKADQWLLQLYLVPLQKQNGIH